MVRMQAMSEVRNQLIAAQRNLIDVHRLLHPIKVPYCNADETDTLGKATNYIFIDGLSRDRQHHALNTYQTTYQRSILLLNWIKTVNYQLSKLPQLNLLPLKIRLRLQKLLKI